MQPGLTRAEKLAIWRDSKRNAEIMKKSTGSQSQSQSQQRLKQQAAAISTTVDPLQTVSAKLSSFVESLEPSMSVIKSVKDENHLNNASSLGVLQEKSNNAENINKKPASIVQSKVDAIRLLLNNASGIDRSIFVKLEEIVDEGRHQFEELITLRNRMKSLTTSLRSYRDETQRKETEIQELTATINRYKSDNERLQSTNREQNTLIVSLQTKLTELTAQQQTLSVAAYTSDEMERLQMELSDLKLVVSEKEQLIEKFAEEYVSSRNYEQIREDNRLLERDLEECYALIEEMKVELEKHENSAASQTIQSEMEARLLALEAHNDRLLGEIMLKDDKILELTDALRETLDENKQSLRQSVTNIPSLKTDKTAQIIDGQSKASPSSVHVGTDPMDDYKEIIHQAHLAMDEYNAMKFANDLMYEQMVENQRRYKEDLDEAKSDVTEAIKKAEYWEKLLDDTIVDIESKSMEILAESVQKYESVLQQLKVEQQKNNELMKLLSSSPEDNN